MPAKFKNYRMTQTTFFFVCGFFFFFFFVFILFCFCFYKKASNIFAKASTPIEEVSVSKTNV